MATRDEIIAKYEAQYGNGEPQKIPSARDAVIEKYNQQYGQGGALKPAAKKDPDFLDYAKEAAKQGIAAGSASAAAGVELIKEGAAAAGIPISGAGFAGIPFGFVSRQIKGQLSQGTTTPQELAIESAKNIGRTYTGVKKEAEQIVGSTGIKPTTPLGRYAFAAAQAPFDLTNYLLPGGGLVARGLYGVAGATGGEAGGDVGKATEKAIAGTDTGVGQVIGAIAGGTAAGVIGGRVPTMINAGKKYQEAKTMARSPETEAAIAGFTDSYADRKIQQVFLEAAKADPNFQQRIDEILAAESNQREVLIKKMLDSGMSREQAEESALKLPVGALAGNPIIDSEIGRIAQRDSSFKAAYYNQYTKAKGELGKLKNIYGDPRLANQRIRDAALKQRDPVPQAEKMKRAVDKKSNAIFVIGKTRLQKTGKEGGRVIDAADAYARKQTAPLYQRAFDIYNQKGLEFPDDAATRLSEMTTTAQAKDVFNKFPEVFKKTSTFFAPESGKRVAESRSPILTPNEIGVYEQRVIPTPPRVWSIENIDSLKRETNLALHKVNPQTERDTYSYLLQLRSSLDDELRRIDPDFYAAYRKADDVYKEKVGIPFNADGVLSVSQARFAEDIVPAITKNKSTVEQFLRASGDDGNDVVRNAFVTDLYEKSVNGRMAPNLWLKKNEEALSAAPGIRSELSEMVNDYDKLQASKADIDRVWLQRELENIPKVTGRTAQDIVNNMYLYPRYTDQFMAEYGKNLGVVNAIRSFMMDDIVKSSDPMAALNDRTKSETFSRVFGSEKKIHQIRDIAAISNALSNDPSDVMTSFKDVIDPSPVKTATGTKLSTAVSYLVTNPVLSTELAITRLTSNFLQGRVEKAISDKMTQVLLDRDQGEKLLKAVSERIAKGYTDKDGRFIEITPESKSVFARLAAYLGKELVKSGAAGGVRSAPAEVEEQEPEMPQDDAYYDYFAQ